jgi:hypothetical protein
MRVGLAATPGAPLASSCQQALRPALPAAALFGRRLCLVSVRGHFLPLRIRRLGRGVGKIALPRPSFFFLGGRAQSNLCRRRPRTDFAFPPKTV